MRKINCLDEFCYWLLRIGNCEIKRNDWHSRGFYGLTHWLHWMRLAASGESSSALPCEQQQQKHHHHHHHHHQHPAHIRGFLGSVGDRLATTCFLTSVVMSSGRGQVSRSDGPVVRSGHLRKYKTLKKKFFVLRGDAPGHPACLEYYDSKKKYDNRSNPKRSITMRSCFNINRRVDTKHMHVIALYTKDECFSLILDNEKELDEWLNAMLLLSGDVPDGEQPRPTFGKWRYFINELVILVRVFYLVIYLFSLIKYFSTWEIIGWLTGVCFILFLIWQKTSENEFSNIQSI